MEAKMMTEEQKAECQKILQETKDGIYELEQKIEKYQALKNLLSALVEELEKEPRYINPFDMDPNPWKLIALINQYRIIATKPIFKHKPKTGGFTIVGENGNETILTKSEKIFDIPEFKSDL
jgi:hypothetical protein